MGVTGPAPGAVVWAFPTAGPANEQMVNNSANKRVRIVLLLLLFPVLDCTSLFGESFISMKAG
jgi:hypothetical protein